MPRKRKDDLGGLTLKEHAFVHAFCGEAQGNGTQAARLAGYKGTEGTLRNAAHKILQRPHVAKAIATFAAKAEAKGISSAVERQALLDDIVWGRVMDVVTTKDGPIEAPASLTVRLAANRDLARMRCEMSEKHEVEHKGAEVRVYLPSNGRD